MGFEDLEDEQRIDALKRKQAPHGNVAKDPAAQEILALANALSGTPSDRAGGMGGACGVDRAGKGKG